MRKNIEPSRRPDSGRGESSSDDEWLPGNDESDEEGFESSAQCAAILKLGSLSDPPELQGAAHFLEHLLFMGNKKYREENDLEDFFDSNGGSCNAFTELEYLCFHFEVEEDSLLEALDRFAHIFVKPRMVEDAISREVNSIDAEFVGALTCEKVRLERLQSHTMHGKHPAGKFHCGNKKSLCDLPRDKGFNVRKMLLDHAMAYCGAQNLLVVIFGTRPLDELAEMAESTFGTLPRAPKDAPDYSNLGLPFQGTKLYVCPAVTAENQVTITWQWPQTSESQNRQAAQYLGALLSHKHEGSLHSALWERGWAIGMEIGTTEDDGFCCNSSYVLFQIRLSLTPAGMRACFNPDAAGLQALSMEPVGLLFQSILQLKQSPLPSHVWQELKIAAEMSFMFSNDIDDDEWLPQVAVAAHQYSIQDCLSPSMYGDFDPEVLGRMVDGLLPNSPNSSGFRVDVQIANAEGVTYDTVVPLFGEDSQSGVEEWCDFPYVEVPIPSELLAKWTTLSADTPLAIAPPPNPYIPQFSEPPSSTLDATHASKVTKLWGDDLSHPRLVDPFDTDEPEVPGIMLDDHDIRVYLACPAFAEHPLLATLFCIHWRTCAAAAMTAGQAAGVNVDFSNVSDNYVVDLCTVEGVTVSFAGYSAAVLCFFDDFWDCFVTACETAVQSCSSSGTPKATNVDLGLLHQIHTEGPDRIAKSYIQQGIVGLLDDVEDFGDSVLEQLLQQPSHAVPPLSSFSGASLPSLAAFTEQMLQSLHCEVLAGGNITSGEARGLAASIRQGVTRAAIACGVVVPELGRPDQSKGGKASKEITPSSANRPMQRCVKLPIASTHIFHVSAHMPGQQKSALVAYYQVGQTSSRVAAICTVLAVGMQQPAYKFLRIKHQLGYIIDVEHCVHCNVSGIKITVAGGADAATASLGQIDQFLESYGQELSRMSKSKFQELQEAAAMELLQGFAGLEDTCDGFWERICDRTYAFKACEHQAESLEKLSLRDTRRFYSEYLSPSSSKRSALLVHVDVVDAADSGAKVDSAAGQDFLLDVCKDGKPHSVLHFPACHTYRRVEKLSRDFSALAVAPDSITEPLLSTEDPSESTVEASGESAIHIGEVAEWQRKHSCFPRLPGKPPRVLNLG